MTFLRYTQIGQLFLLEDTRASVTRLFGFEREEL